MKSFLALFSALVCVSPLAGQAQDAKGEPAGPSPQRSIVALESGKGIGEKVGELSAEDIPEPGGALLIGILGMIALLLRRI